MPLHVIMARQLHWLFLVGLASFALSLSLTLSPPSDDIANATAWMEDWRFCSSSGGDGDGSDSRVRV